MWVNFWALYSVSLIYVLVFMPIPYYFDCHSFVTWFEIRKSDAFSNSTPGYITKKNPKILIRKDTCTPMLIAALFAIAKILKPPKCPSTDEWIKKMWYIYIMEYYSTIKKNEISPFVATWMDLEGIMLSKISQTEKDKYCMLSLTCGI